MKIKTKYFFYILFTVLCLQLFISCDSEYIQQESQSFDLPLQGTWITNDLDSIYSGSLVITYNRITISGYGEIQTPIQGGNDIERPFRNLTKEVPLSGYSEEGRIFITDAGFLQEGIPYFYWEDIYPPEYHLIQFLRFEFGGRQQTLRKISEL